MLKLQDWALTDDFAGLAIAGMDNEGLDIEGLDNGGLNIDGLDIAGLNNVGLDTIRYDTRCYFNVRSKADISRLNLPHGNDN